MTSTPAYAVSKLAQWDICLLPHMDRLGMQAMLVTQKQVASSSRPWESWASSGQSSTIAN